MVEEAVECEASFADDVLSEGVAGLTRVEMQDVQELANFFERKVSAYQVAVQGEVAFDHAF
jgi:ribonucleoside-diphosphate reductase beta chain